MISGLFIGQIPKDVSGPIGMYEATSNIRLNQGFLAIGSLFWGSVGKFGNSERVTFSGLRRR